VAKALVLRGRPPAAAAAIERRRAELEASSAPGGAGDRTIGEHTKATSKSAPAAAFLHRLVQSLAPTSVLEMGTSVGISGAYLASALPSGGRLITLDILPMAVVTARETFRSLGLGDRAEVIEGSFADTLEPAMQRLAPIDFMFIDGHHEEKATIRYLDAAIPHLAPDAVLVFDDIRWSPGMERAWAVVSARAPGFAVALGSLGVWANAPT